jgi:hypothetical protein
LHEFEVEFVGRRETEVIRADHYRVENGFMNFYVMTELGGPEAVLTLKATAVLSVRRQGASED